MLRAVNRGNTQREFGIFKIRRRPNEWICMQPAALIPGCPFFSKWRRVQPHGDERAVILDPWSVLMKPARNSRTADTGWLIIVEGDKGRPLLTGCPQTSCSGRGREIGSFVAGDIRRDQWCQKWTWEHSMTQNTLEWAHALDSFSHLTEKAYRWSRSALFPNRVWLTGQRKCWPSKNRKGFNW